MNIQSATQTLEDISKSLEKITSELHNHDFITKKRELLGVIKNTFYEARQDEQTYCFVGANKRLVSQITDEGTASIERIIRNWAYTDVKEALAHFKAYEILPHTKWQYCKEIFRYVAEKGSKEEFTPQVLRYLTAATYSGKP